MDETAGTVEREADLEAETRNGADVRLANLAPAFTPEAARAAGKLSGEARRAKPWSVEVAVRAILRRRLDNGERRGTVMARKLVECAEGGDVRAIELAAKLDGWRPTTSKVVRHVAEARVLVHPGGDQRGSVLELQAAAPAQLEAADPSSAAAADTGAVSGKCISVAQDSAASVDTVSVQAQPDTAPSEAWTDGTD